MYYLDGRDQREIAELLTVSRSTVSRLLTSARERGIVRISVDDYDPCDGRLEARLREHYDLRHAIVVRTLGRPGENVRGLVGYFAAPAVSRLIESGMTLGVAGGRTLGDLVGYLRPKPEVRNLTAVQLMGYIGPTATGIDAPELSRALADRFGGTFYTLTAPAFVQDGPARDMLLAHEHIRQVWGLFGSLDLAFVGIGSLEESAFVERGMLGPADRARLRDAGAVGEVCGRFFDRNGRECATEYRDRVLSIDLDVLRRRPDVVGVTNGPRRAAAVRAALRGGLITSLVIDDVGAAAVLAVDDDA
jgi:DNA-binding transcriptional regulator LsrR (DeoR family)